MGIMQNLGTILNIIELPWPIGRTIRAWEQTLPRRAATRTVVKGTLTAISEGKKEQAQTLFKEAERSLAKAARRKILHKRNVSRRLSRLAARLKAAS